jgi:ribosomal protein L29
MGATRYDYEGREEFYDKLLHVIGISKGAAGAYVTNILRPEHESAYKTAKNHWESLMGRPIPTLSDVIKTHLYHDDVTPEQEDDSSDDESSEDIEYELSYVECIELIEELKEERQRLFDERQGMKTSIHLQKSNISNLKRHISTLTTQLNQKLGEVRRYKDLSEAKDKTISKLQSGSNDQTQSSSQEIEMLKAVIADQAILIYALHQSKGCDHV